MYDQCNSLPILELKKAGWLREPTGENCPRWSPKEPLLEFTYPFFVYKTAKGRFVLSSEKDHPTWHPYARINTPDNIYDMLLLVKKYRYLHTNGMSYRAIARQEGVTIYHVSKILGVFSNPGG